VSTQNGPNRPNLQGFHVHKTALMASCFREINAPRLEGVFLPDILQLLHANTRLGTPLPLFSKKAGPEHTRTGPAANTWGVFPRKVINTEQRGISP